MGLCLLSGPAPIPSLTLTPSLSPGLLHASGFHLLLCCWGGAGARGACPTPSGMRPGAPQPGRVPPPPSPIPLLSSPPATLLAPAPPWGHHERLLPVLSSSPTRSVFQSPSPGLSLTNHPINPILLILLDPYTLPGRRQGVPGYLEP